MKKHRQVLFIIHCIALFLIAGCQTQKNNKSQLIHARNQQPSQAVLDILNYYEISHNGSLHDIVTKTQKAWLDGNCIIKKPFPTELFKKLHSCNIKPPKLKKYNYALLFGTNNNQIKSRLQYLIRLWEDGIRFSRLIILTSTQKISDKKIESTHIHDVLESLEKPKSFNKLKKIYVIAQAKNNESCKNNLAKLALELWIKNHPKPGKILAISSEPFIGYHHCLLKNIVPCEFYIETIGKTSTFDIKNESQYLQSLAQWLYTEYKYDK